MISKNSRSWDSKSKNCLCSEPSKIENYDKAIADTTQVWVCHHRLETHTSDGERRLVDLTPLELEALDMYYHRPPEELIFLTREDHQSLHGRDRNQKASNANKGKHHSEETKQKISNANKGRTSPKKGKPLSNETKCKLSIAKKGKLLSNETKRKMSIARKGKPKSEETKRKMSNAKKDKHWKLVDGRRVWY